LKSTFKKLYHLLPWSRLSPAAQRGLWAHALQYQAVAVGSLYVGVYLFRLSNGYAAPAWHSLCSYFMVPVGYAMAAAVTRMRGPGFAMRLGLLVYALFQAIILCLGDQAVVWAGSLGLLWGIGNGLYWQAWVLLIMDLSTEGADRDTMMGGNQGVYFLANLTGAPLAGWFLGRFIGTQGYPWAFGLSLILFAASAWVSLPLKGKIHPGSNAVRRLLIIRKPRGWKPLLFSAGLMGVSSVAMLFLPMLLAYDVGRNEGLGGLYAFGSAVVGFSGTWAFSRFSKPESRGSILIGAALTVLCCTLPLAYHRSLGLVMLYGLGMAVALSLFNVPIFATHIRVVQSNPHFAYHRADAMFIREWTLMLGRALACGTVLWGVSSLNSQGLTWLLVGVALTPLLNYLVMRRYVSGPV
jgi:MFS transporter, YQGE family, putative transporter